MVQICSFNFFSSFKLKGYWFKSSEHSKFLNSVNTNTVRKYCTSLLCYYTVQLSHKKLIIYFLFKNFLLQKQCHPIPHPLPFICTCSMPQHRKKDYTAFVCLSLLISLQYDVGGAAVVSHLPPPPSSKILKCLMEQKAASSSLSKAEYLHSVSYSFLEKKPRGPHAPAICCCRTLPIWLSKALVARDSSAVGSG